MKDEPIPPWLTHKLGQILSSAKLIADGSVHTVPILLSPNVIRHADQVLVRPQSHSLPLVFSPPGSAYRPDPPIDYANPSRPYSQVDSPPVVPPQSRYTQTMGILSFPKVKMNILMSRLTFRF